MKRILKSLSALIAGITVLLSSAPVSADSGYTASGELYCFSDDTDNRYGKITVTDSDGTVCASSYEMTGNTSYTVYAHLEGNVKLIAGKGNINVVTRGDVNGDKKITATDASMAFSAYKAAYKGQDIKLDSKQKFAANVDWGYGANVSSEITAQDASYIFSYYKEFYKNRKAKWPFLS